MKSMFVVLLFMVMCRSLSGWAVSSLYDAEAAVVLKSGVPCFYVPYPISNTPSIYSDGQGVQLDVFSNSVATPGYVWRAWRKNRPAVLPLSPESCIPYGTMSKEWVGQPSVALLLSTSYEFEMGGELGRYGLFFCILRDKRGEKYLSRSDHKGTCSSEPLIPVPSSIQR